MLAYLANACNNFRFMEGGSSPDEEKKGAFDDSFEDQVSESDDDESSDSLDGNGNVKQPKGNSMLE